MCLVTQLCPTLLRLHGLYSPTGCSVHVIFQARILAQVSILSRGSSPLRDPTWVTCISSTGRWILYHWSKREAIKNNSVFKLVSADMDLQIDYSWPSLYMNFASPISTNADWKYLKNSIELYKPKFQFATPIMLAII